MSDDMADEPPAPFLYGPDGRPLPLHPVEESRPATGDESHAADPRPAPVEAFRSNAERSLHLFSSISELALFGKFVITLFTLGFPAAVGLITEHLGLTGSMSASSVALPFVDFLRGTTLTLSMAVLVYFHRRNKLNAVGIFAIIIGGAVASYFLGIGAHSQELSAAWHFSTTCTASGCTSTGATSPLQVLDNVVHVYWHIYGPAAFVASLVCGVILGCVPTTT